jgi:hypothetical protein
MRDLLDYLRGLYHLGRDWNPLNAHGLASRSHTLLSSLLLLLLLLVDPRELLLRQRKEHLLRGLRTHI